MVVISGRGQHGRTLSKVGFVGSVLKDSLNKQEPHPNGTSRQTTRTILGSTRCKFLYHACVSWYMRGTILLLRSFLLETFNVPSRGQLMVLIDFRGVSTPAQMLEIIFGSAPITATSVPSGCTLSSIDLLAPLVNTSLSSQRQGLRTDGCTTWLAWLYS